MLMHFFRRPKPIADRISSFLCLSISIQNLMVPSSNNDGRLQKIMKVSHHINDCYSFIVTCFWSHNVVIMMIVWKFKFCSWCFQEILFLPWLPTIVTLSAVSSCWWWYTKEVQAHLHAQTFINEICRWWYPSTSTLFWAEAWRGGDEGKTPKKQQTKEKRRGTEKEKERPFPSAAWEEKYCVSLNKYPLWCTRWLPQVFLS